jgi:hypothetical protein
MCEQCGVVPARQKYCRACYRAMHCEQVKTRKRELRAVERAAQIAQGVPAPRRGRPPTLAVVPPFKEAS